MDRLFDTEKFYTYNEKGRELASEMRLLIEPIIRKVKREKIDNIDAENILLAEVTIAFCEMRLTMQAINRRNNNA